MTFWNPNRSMLHGSLHGAIKTSELVTTILKHYMEKGDYAVQLSRPEKRQKIESAMSDLNHVITRLLKFAESFELTESEKKYLEHLERLKQGRK